MVRDTRVCRGGVQVNCEWKISFKASYLDNGNTKAFVTSHTAQYKARKHHYDTVVHSDETHTS